ncbi:hypothetical protein AGMMS50276_14500 [Synergistales bacterium]|nr:hypothetical protein AGMMS50276_14500 [Synergistales bacterium]
MKIYAICRIHNESDIAESLCRYTLLFCDGIIIYDTYSTDNTKEIIQKMIAEGLPLYLMEEPESGYSAAINDMLRIAIERFHADLVLPVDADEFLFCQSGDNPRSVLEALEPETEYRIPWQTFVFTQSPNDNTRFLPTFFPYHREEEVVQTFKTVISRDLFQKYGCKFALGNHSILYPNQAASTVPVEDLSMLLAYAHYPLRGVYQAMSKCILFEYGLSMQIYRDYNKGFQYKEIFDAILQHGKLTIEEVKRFSIEYALKVPTVQLEKPLSEYVQLVEDPLVVSFDEGKLALRYTDYSEDENKFLRMVFSTTYGFILWQTDNLRRSEEERKKLAEDIRRLEGQISDAKKA